MRRILPILDWLPGYKREYLSGDLSAGLIVGIMLIPQGMAYAMIAGLPPVYGLYASLIPQVVYSLFGSSRQLSVGPVAMDSLLVAAGVSAFATAGSEDYISMAIILAGMMGAVQLAFGAFRLGFLVNFLSRPVIKGFTTAAALVIGLNQLKHILGVSLDGASNVVNILIEAIGKIGDVNVWTILIGILGIILIVGVKRINKSVPGPLVVVVLGILITYGFDLVNSGVRIVGEVPGGLPKFLIPSVQGSTVVELIPIALTLALIGFMESISIAKAIQERHRKEYTIDNNREMIGLGMANLVGSLLGSYPTTGGFSRSAVNDEAGAKTNMASIFSAVLIGLTLLFLTDLFYYLPNAILGSVIMVAVYGLMDVRYPGYLWRTSRQDFILWIIAFILTLLLGIKEGIAAGILLSLFMLVFRTSRPHIAVLGKLPGTDDYRNVNRFTTIETREDVLVIRQDAQLYFANISNFVETLTSEAGKKPKLKLIVVHCGSVSSIDATALHDLEQLVQNFDEQGVKMVFSGLIGPVRDFLHKSGFMLRMGSDRFFVRVQSAVDFHNNDAVPDSEFMVANQVNRDN